MVVCTVDFLTPPVYLEHVTLDITVLKDQMSQIQNFLLLEQVVHVQLVVIAITLPIGNLFK